MESILRGSVKPERILVWLDKSLSKTSLPASLKRIQKRGVEFFFMEDIGPHQKYFYTLDIALKSAKAIATIDDDCIYPKWWMKELYESHLYTPKCIVCYRSRIFSFDKNMDILSYKEWPYCNFNTTRRNVFFTGVSGVLYPLSFLFHIKMFGKGFLECCPQADDIWLNYISAKNKYPARQVYLSALDFSIVPSTQDSALWVKNQSGGNDEQIRKTYDIETLNYIKYIS
jgi:hypothetical protein